MTFLFIVLITLIVALGATFIVLVVLKRKKKINFPKPSARTTRDILIETSDLPQLTENNERDDAREEGAAELTEVEGSVLPDTDAGSDSSIDID
jgi:hypothetical protein